ncbi:hypothetical protein PVAND_015819 [Polypedilum vanderplanki]|uniref:Uncharacterized protein n=1 Tax=Polypedilum vanderplanki TaxID=319348 RepID=A0A9J6BDR2_POLVA|nr:hypothetical protein PVAND_015819 [Polypedilum vanderplanki]
MKSLRVKFFIILYYCFMIFIHPTRSINLNCHFRVSAWWPGPTYYECEDTQSSIQTEEEAIVTGVHGSHMSGKNNDDVKSFYSYRKIMLFFPKGLENYFKNLEIIGIVNEKLPKIEQNDLKPFYKLRVLYLDGNQIETLEPDLFKYNLNIEAINLSNNKIKYVDVSVFKHLVSLKTLWFENNHCHSGKISDSATDVIKVIDDIRERCFVDKILNNLQNFQEFELTNLKAEIAALKVEISNLQTENTDLKVENAKITAENTNLSENLEKCLNDKNEFKNDLKSCNAEMREFTKRTLRPGNIEREREEK